MNVTKHNTRLSASMSDHDKLHVASFMLKTAAHQANVFFENAPEQPYTTSGIETLIESGLLIQGAALKGIRDRVESLRRLESNISERKARSETCAELPMRAVELAKKMAKPQSKKRLRERIEKIKAIPMMVAQQN